jgi:hypothetical protein
MAFSVSTTPKPVLILKETPSSVGTVSKDIVLGSSLLSSVVDVLLADSSGNITNKILSEDVTVQDLTNSSSPDKIRAFGLNASGSVVCGIIFISSTNLDVRDALIFPNGVVEVHAKTSTTSTISYSA